MVPGSSRGVRKDKIKTNLKTYILLKYFSSITRNGGTESIDKIVRLVLLSYANIQNQVSKGRIRHFENSGKKYNTSIYIHMFQNI